MKLQIFFYFFTSFLLTILDTHSQVEDSVKHYYLKEITVKGGIVLEPKTVLEIDNREIEKSDASSIGELARYIPSMKLQINSRGETLFYLRGSGERQIALFFDGIPLNIPWDNRIDLSLIPTDAIGRINVTRGIPSVIYGANTPAGVVNINSKEYSASYSPRKISLQLGENNFQKYSGYWIDGNEKYSYMISMSYKTTDGYRLPKSYNNPQANPTQTRINSFSSHFNSFARFNYKLSNTFDLGASVSYIASKKGVPPETDVDQPRYWQYPLWQKLTLIINGTHRFGENRNSILVYSLSGSKFKMQIDQYKDITFTDFDDIEKDDDIIIYGRINFTQLFGLNSILKLAASGYTTTHKEKFLATNFEEELIYSQNVFSTGAEYQFIQDKYTATLGISYDGSITPRTGDKSSQDPMYDYGINSSFVYSFTPSLNGQINFGRKTRFPTLRETFSGALGKFIINPELKAEVAYSGEVGLSYNFKKGKADLNLFLTYLKDGIIRAVVQTDSGNRYKRINKDRTRTFGVEFNSYFDITETTTAHINFTYLNAYAQNPDGEFKDTLEYKPNFVAGLILDHSFLDRFNTVIEVNYVGKEFGLQSGNEYFQKLPDYLLFNIRFSHSFEPIKDVKLQAFLRINNIFDKLYYTQWSLPEAGRQFWGGLNLEF
ncbi:MAG: hypothetical protein A2V66_04435 [Ignavibacteria bacterium RBG_13_36_8]|nr:MAG: hypothetical protein A2V66_04435 [Ignavibacteria bacterium RBG_13_36_8]